MTMRASDVADRPDRYEIAMEVLVAGAVDCISLYPLAADANLHHAEAYDRALRLYRACQYGEDTPENQALAEYRAKEADRVDT